MSDEEDDWANCSVADCEYKCCKDLKSDKCFNHTTNSPFKDKWYASVFYSGRFVGGVLLWAKDFEEFKTLLMKVNGVPERPSLMMCPVPSTAKQPHSWFTGRLLSREEVIEATGESDWGADPYRNYH